LFVGGRPATVAILAIDAGSNGDDDAIAACLPAWLFACLRVAQEEFFIAGFPSRSKPPGN